MECGNPDCDKGELLKKFLSVVEKEEEIPKFCSFCKSPLRRSTFEKPKDETPTSQATEKAKKRDYGRNTEESQRDETNTLLQDEKATKATSQYSHDYGSPIASGTDRKLSEDATNANQTREGDATCSTTGQALQDSSAIESRKDETNAPLKDGKATEATSQYIHGDGSPIASGTDRKLSEDATNANQTREGDATCPTTGQALQDSSAIVSDQEINKGNLSTNYGFDRSKQKLMKNKTESFCDQTQSNLKSQKDELTFENPCDNMKWDSKKQIDSLENQNENIYSSTNKETIFGVTGFRSSDTCVANTGEKHPPSSNNDAHHAENVWVVKNENENQIESSSMLNNSNNNDYRKNKEQEETSNTENNNNESTLPIESKKNGKEQEVKEQEAKDDSPHDICDDEQQSVSEEETQSGQGKGSVCYDKEVIKQKRKERNKRKQGGKKDVPKDKKVDSMKEEKEHLTESQKRNQLSEKKSQKTGEPISCSPPDQQEPLQHQQQSVQEPSNQQAIYPPIDKMAEECATIVFHGLLSPDFHFKPNEQTIAIKAGHEELGSWEWDCVDIEPISKTADKFWLVRGEMQLPVRLLHEPIPYKYVVWSIKDKTVHWEYSEFSNDYSGTIVNRLLALFDTYKKEGAIWHQYDGVIYPGLPKEKSGWSRFWQWWGNNRDLVLKNRQLAAKTFLPKWKGFVVNTHCEPMSVTEAIERTNAISECLSNVYISPYRKPVGRTVYGLEFNKILIEFLRPMLQYNAKLTQTDLEHSEVRVDRLVSSLAITHLIAHYSLDQYLLYVHLKDIIHCLVLQARECEFHELHKYFHDNLWRELAEDIVFLLTSATYKNHMHSCPDVILAVPLLHFLRHDSKPFEEPEETQAKTVEEWCHLEGLPQTKLYTRFVENFLPKAMPMFTLDPLLRRVFLYFSPSEDFPTLSGNIAFPVHEICTALYFKVRAENTLMTKFDSINETLSVLMKRFQTPREGKGKLSNTLVCLRSAKSLLQELKKKVVIKDKVFLTSVQFAIVVLSTVDDPEDEHQNEEEDDNIKHECEAFFFGIVDMVEDAIEKEFTTKIALSRDRQIKELETWTTLLNMNVNKKNLQNNWTESLVPLFAGRLKKLREKNVIDMFCEVEMEKLHHDLVQSITNHAFCVAERIIEKGESDEHSFSALRHKSLRDGGSSKAGELLSRMLVRAWGKAMANITVTDQAVLQYILKWKPWIGFITFYGSLGNKKILSQDANKLVQRVISHLRSIQDALSDRSIDVGTLTSLNQYQDSFTHLCCALSKVQPNADEKHKRFVEDVKVDLNKRSKELECFQTSKRHLQDFINICNSNRDVAFDFKGLHEKLRCKTSDLRLVEICQRVPSSDSFSEERIDVIFFEDLPESFLSILPHLSDAYNSSIFQGMWKKNCKIAYRERQSNPLLSGGLTLLEVQNKVWQPSIEKWKQLARSIYNGSILLKDVDRNFNNEKDLTKELSVMFLTVNGSGFSRDRAVKERVSQIIRYRGLQEYIEASETVWKFKEALGLTGDFSIIEQLRNQASEEFKDKNLGSIDIRFTNAGEDLKVISLENSHCLDAVIECEPLVKWLRETIKDTSALSTLVDLAMISAGENDLEVDRISNFHTSCLNFAPLIFDLNEEFGFEELMRACKPVWNAVKEDKKLSKKLVETCRHLEWLKAVQSSHGSVEMSSIMQAKAINSSGVFRVGQITQDLNKSLSVSSGKKDLDSVFTLTVPIDQKTRDPRRLDKERFDSEEKDELKTYSLNDLKDLQSKLMLIAGKTAQLQNKDCIESAEEINRFVEVLEGMMRLGRVYIDLCEAGDVKFLDWSKEVHCSDNRLSTHLSVAQELAETSHSMEERLKKWKTHVHRKRRHYKQLNFYTTKQILVMRRELGLLRDGTTASAIDMPLHVYTLLESVFQDITSQDLYQVLNETLGFKTDVRITAISESLLPTPAPNQGSFRSANLKEKYQSFFVSVVQMGFDEDVAFAALKANDVVHNQDVRETDLITWCMDNGDDEETVSDWLEKTRGDRDYVDLFPELWQEEGEEEDDDDEKENEKEKGERGTDLERSCIDGLYDVATGQVPTEDKSQDDFEQPPYLTLDELGSLLAKLSTKCVKLNRRRFPDYLGRERPNLILVPKGEMLPTVLSLYMQYGGNSLPTPNEVLVCTHETTAEEVELFWWRAFEDTNQQMFCLVNPDVLDYNVSQTAVIMFNMLMHEFTGTSGECRIIILCSTENEDRSHIIAALDEYRLNASPSCASAHVLSDYLTNQFTCSASLTGYFNEERVTWIPAAHLDNDRLAVRMVTSDRAGVGKSLIVTRLFERISDLQNNRKIIDAAINIPLTVTVPLHGTVANTSPLLDALCQYSIRGDLPVSRVVHLDVPPSVLEGLDKLLFNLLVLGVLYDSSGRLWRRRTSDLYLIEMTNCMVKEPEPSTEQRRVSFVSLLPTIKCTSPRTTLQNLKAKENLNSPNPLFDEQEYRSIPIQRAFQYLRACDLGQSLDRYRFTPGNLVGTQAECLALIIKYCGIGDPSWAELKHFVDFLNSQVQDCEESTYCKPENVDDQWMQGTLKGFKSFVVRFMVTMSRDFATPSLEDKGIVCSAGLCEEDDDEEIRPLQLRRRWESSPHPYIFFNQDRITMTFLGFHINANGDLIDPDTKVVIQSGLMTKQLKGGLDAQRVDFKTNYSAWSKEERIDKLCSVMGVEKTFDPDASYELTIDNMKKILAIHMRFRCGIPVVIMGETGCGKTRLIRYMCALQAGPKGQRNMLLMKVHGGTSYEDITKKVEQVEKMAAENEKQGIDTVLFFDEANTTNALGMIKEVMVDRRINGRPVGVGLCGLHFIAACNPYRRHTNEMIKKLESAGLGYSVKSEETKDKLGKIPLRHLVYRVHALPASMRPLVWDFGQLKPEIEELYIRQIVSRYVLTDKTIPGDQSLVKAVSNVLAAAQRHMRAQQDECSFVSLRDVERTMTVMKWFYQHRLHLRPQATHRGDDNEDEERPLDMITWSLLLSLGVCYQAKLQHRSPFRKAVVSACRSPLDVNGGESRMDREIVRCQRVMIDELSLGANIARNTALSENVFMMVVCIELRIPLFVIGKPGSSKSLAKTVVADNMQGDASKSQLFKNFKRAHMVSYQCSPLSTPDGIVATFRQCRRLQKNNPDGRYASVVVLDEVGLAEDSPLMPLKTLHPLLEDGVTSSDDVIEMEEKPTRVAFIGISNWALDPAKMNRGLMLMRAEPSEKELQDSARGICAEKEDVRRLLSTLLNQLAAGYAELYKKQKKFESLRKSKRDEFFGLRDFYSLVKMVYSITAEKERKPTWTELENAIRRNFGGLDEIDAVEIFREHVTDDDMMQETEPVSTLDLLRASLDHKNAIGESRYLLVLTENYSALRIVEQQLDKNKEDYVVIFGSSFPKDQEYTQVCRNINQIKVCMETGRTVLLLNLESLYESLYDALNQYYVYCADQKYVDLGLGSHRVKCRVDDKFRLIVIAEKDVVYKKFPIPLINRLEKHYLVTSKSLSRYQIDLTEDLRDWALEFAKIQTQPHESKQNYEIGDVFIGYQSDTIPAMVLQMCAEPGYQGDEIEVGMAKVKERCQNLLVQCATPDAIARLSRTKLKTQEKGIWNMYFSIQEHSSLSACLARLLDEERRRQSGFLVQVSTHSRLLSEKDLTDICQVTRFKRLDIELLTLQQFQTEQQFLKQVRDFFISLSCNEGILLVQCNSGDDNFNLIACTRHLLMDQRLNRTEMLKENLKKYDNVPPVHLVIIVQLPRVKGGCVNFVGFQGGQWDSFHVDDLRPPTNQIPPIQTLIDSPISELLKPDSIMPWEMDVDITNDETQNEETVSMQDDENEVQTSSNDVEVMRTEDDVMQQNLTCKTSGQDRLSESRERFDPMVLLRRSVQAAAGRLEDDPVMAKRATERIDLILSLLPEDSSKMPDGPSFARILHLKIYRLLEEKNDKQIGIDRARHWVRNEALSGTGMHERGTFRKALLHKLQSEVEPLLAKLFAYADRDCNLDLLREHEPWMSRLWLSIFNNERLSEIYDSSMEREYVQVSGRGSHAFRCCFPFSWLIKELVDDLWRGIFDVSTRSSESKEEKLRGMMENSELGHILAIIKEEGKNEEAARRYLHDFVHMVYQPSKETQDEEVQLVSRAVISAAEKRSRRENYLDFSAIHVAFNLIQSRINNFNLLVQADPDLTRILITEPQRQLTIDVAALVVCLEKLQPSLLDLESHENRNQWCGRVLNIRKSIEAMTSKEEFCKKFDEIGGYEEEEKNVLKLCWTMWQRLNVVRIFIDYVCNMSQQPNAEDAQYVLRLWKILGDDTNFMKEACIQRLQGFLLECSQEHRKRNKCFEEVTCTICLRQANQPSMTPCEHFCCLECATRWFSENSFCPSCRQAVYADYIPTESEHMRESINNITAFRDQCNSFFMEVVSLFCFGYSPCGTLEEDAYKLLMGYVTGAKDFNTKQFSPFPDQGIDVNPVVRSFLLQQLLKSSDEKVKKYMDLFIKRAQGVGEMNEQFSVEVYVMCIQCMEDVLNNKFSKRVSELPFDKKLPALERNFKDAAEWLCQIREDQLLDVKLLERIANTRFVLSLAANFMYLSRTETKSEEWSHPDVNRALDRLLFEVKNICVQTLLPTPRLFLLKQLSRKFGFESIGVLAKEFEWTLPPALKASSHVTQDRFLVYGLEYQTLRETISRSVVSGDMDSIKEVLENLTSTAPVINVALLLGIYREVTENEQNVITESTQHSLENFLQKSRHICEQSRVLARDFMRAETQNSISNVFKIAGDTTWDRSMVEIIIHLAAVLFSRESDDLVGPLFSLALHPGTTVNSFLPTMPDDPLQDVRAAVIGQQMLYECPNGHPYLVTECGRPMEKSRCRARGCGAEIGGTDHRLTDTNRSARTTDMTSEGHCLGSPDERESEPIPEREMSALVTCLMRLLVHGCMLIGSCYQAQDLLQIISPVISQQSVLGFLWKHAMCDLHLLSKVSGRSVDDTALIVHMVLQNICKHAQTNHGHYDVLKTKDQRKQWEKNFSTAIVVPLMANLESGLQKTMELIVNDKRFGANTLLRQLYELESGVIDSNEIKPNCMTLWRFRTPVTLDHVTRAFNESAHVQDGDCVVLREFLKQEHKLRAVKFLPDVVKLQQLLMDRFHRTLDKTETDKLKWKDFEKHLPKGAVKEYKALRKSFRLAWNILAATVTEQGTKGPLKKLSQLVVQDDSPMSMFIPATSGLGTCSLTLVRFLVDTHNEIMEHYRRYSKHTNLQSVPLPEVMCSQLVSYDADRDLLPLIHAHCQYSLEVGHGTLVEYDWPAIQRQLIDRLVRGRTLVNFEEDEFTKTAQVSAKLVLTTLKSKIPQVELSIAIQNQIVLQYRSLQDICEALSSLNIAIKFLASGGGKPNMLISKYIHEVLKLPKDTGLRNSKAQEVCQIHHVVSLWRLLSIERAKILTKRGQDPLEHLSPDFKEKLVERKVQLSLNDALRKMNEGCLDVFVCSLFEFIVLHLNDEMHIYKENSLKYYISSYLDEKYAESIENIPDEVLLKHVVHFWQIVLGMSDKYHERRVQATG